MNTVGFGLPLSVAAASGALLALSSDAAELPLVVLVLVVVGQFSLQLLDRFRAGRRNGGNSGTYIELAKTVARLDARVEQLERRAERIEARADRHEQAHGG